MYLATSTVLCELLANHTCMQSTKIAWNVTRYKCCPPMCHCIVLLCFHMTSLQHCVGTGLSRGRCPTSSSGEACCSNVWKEATKWRNCKCRYFQCMLCDPNCSCCVTMLYVFATGTLDDSSNDVDGDAKRMQQRKLQRSPKVVKAHPPLCDGEHGLESSMDNSGLGSGVSKVQNSRKRSVDRREKLSMRKTKKNGKPSVASGAAEAAGTPDHESRNTTEGGLNCHLFCFNSVMWLLTIVLFSLLVRSYILIAFQLPFT